MRERINFIDYSKALGILFVVFGHVYCGSNIVTNWIYSFHMPLFFIISGMLLNNKNSILTLKELILRKFKSIIIPYLIFSILNCFGYYFIDKFSFITLKSGILQSVTLFGIGALWFLPALFIAETIFITFKTISNNKKMYKIIYILFLLLIFYIIGNLHEYINIVIKRAVVALFFISVGYCSRNIIKKINIKNYNLFLMMLINIIFADLNKGVDLYSLEFNNIIFYVLNSITGSLAIIFMMKKINSSKILDFFGKNTLIIMATHQLIIEAILKSSLIKYLNDIMIIFIILLLEYPLIKIINKYLPFMLGKKREKSIVTKENNVVIG